LKRNQIMITALAVMIAIAGYLNFAGNKISEESLVVADEVMTEEEMTALLDLSEEDILSDIGSLEEDAQLTENYLDVDMEESDKGEAIHKLIFKDIYHGKTRQLKLSIEAMNLFLESEAFSREKATVIE